MIIFLSPPLSVQSVVFIFACIEDNAHLNWGAGGRVYTSVHTHTLFKEYVFLVWV